LSIGYSPSRKIFESSNDITCKFRKQKGHSHNFYFKNT
jgi:hypothetical protein